MKVLKSLFIGAIIGAFAVGIPLLILFLANTFGVFVTFWVCTFLVVALCSAMVAYDNM